VQICIGRGEKRNTSIERETPTREENHDRIKCSCLEGRAKEVWARGKFLSLQKSEGAKRGDPVLLSEILAGVQGRSGLGCGIWEFWKIAQRALNGGGA